MWKYSIELAWYAKLYFKDKSSMPMVKGCQPFLYNIELFYIILFVLLNYLNDILKDFLSCKVQAVILKVTVILWLHSCVVTLVIKMWHFKIITLQLFF